MPVPVATISAPVVCPSLWSSYRRWATTPADDTARSATRHQPYTLRPVPIDELSLDPDHFTGSVQRL